MSSVNEVFRYKDYEIKNRLVMAPMNIQKAKDDGLLAEEHLEFYSQRVKKSNIGIVIVEANNVSAIGRTRPGQLTLSVDAAIDKHKELVNELHSAGSLAIVQLTHGGAGGLYLGEENRSPSAIQDEKNSLISNHPMSLNEIGVTVKDFVEAARRAKVAGYDGIELHAAHGYLLNEFYSPYTNKRTDGYGGSLENRLRFINEIIHGIRTELGARFLIFVRLGAVDELAVGEQGSTVEDGIAAVKLLEKEGIDFIDISGGIGVDIKGRKELGFFNGITSVLKRETSIPVIVTGGVKSHEDVEQLLEEEKGDFVGVARALLANPAWGE